MAPAKNDNRDIAIAYKAICLHRDLTGDFKSVGAAIMDHLNVKTGQCDPSLERISRMLNMSEKNVRRATARLCELGLFQKKSHGGKAGRASYTPQWRQLRVVVADWQARMKTGSAPDFDTEDRTELSGADEPNYEGEPDRIVLQTKPRNQTKNQMAANDRSEGEAARDLETMNSGSRSLGLLSRSAEVREAPRQRPTERAATPGCSRSDAAKQAAERRLHKAIGCEPDEWRRAIWLLDVEDMDAAVGAEIDRRGDGIAVLRVRMRTAKTRYDAGQAARASS